MRLGETKQIDSLYLIDPQCDGQIERTFIGDLIAIQIQCEERLEKPQRRKFTNFASKNSPRSVLLQTIGKMEKSLITNMIVFDRQFRQ